jgi:CTP synthase
LLKRLSFGVEVAKRKTKYIFVTGGVLSGLGKGITIASLGNILKARGFLISVQKCDPYLNTDAGTLNPAEHGEVFVTSDGAETDMDLGHYERFIDRELTCRSSLMSGRVYAKVIADEREGKYLGKTVQIIPHVTSEINRMIIAAGKGADIHLVEIGGTVGDYESQGFLEAIRQFKRLVGPENVLYVHLVYLPYLEASKELKTKPAQNTIRDLREAGINPDVIIARADRPVSQHLLDKISLFGDIDRRGIVALPTVEIVYDVPLVLEESGIGNYIIKKLGLRHRRPHLAEWKRLVESIKLPTTKVIKVGVVAKYLAHSDTYMSVVEAVKAAAWANAVSAEVVWVDAEQLGKGSDGIFEFLDGIIVPGGFGSRGVEGKISAASFAMERGKPYLGLCLGMQMAVIAVARKALGTNNVNSTEIDERTKHPVIHIMPDQAQIKDKGGTMRLGDYPCRLEKGSISAKAYGQKRVMERHRHRYEFNNEYRQVLQSAGLRLVGISPNRKLVEIIELEGHPFFVASQFHPEFKSRPNRPHPLFNEFIKAVLAESDKKTESRSLEKAEI